jgi:hypothetical protein
MFIARIINKPIGILGSISGVNVFKGLVDAHG